jgi:hypothetical protein
MPDWHWWGTRFKWVVTCLVFFALPLLLLTFAISTRWDAAETEILETEYGRLDGVLLQLRRRDRTEHYLTDLIRTVFWSGKNESDRVAVWRRGIATLQQRFSGLFTFAVVDEEGKLIEELSPGSPSKAVLQRFWRAAGQDRPNEELRKEMRPCGLF